jgi:carbamoyltransferase
MAIRLPSDIPFFYSPYYWPQELPKPEANKFYLAVNGCHNGSIVIAKGSTIIEHLEFERLLGIKNVGIADYLTPPNNLIFPIWKRIMQFLMNKHNIELFDICFYNATYNILTDKKHSILDLIPITQRIEIQHHVAHAMGSLYQSPYNEALCVTADGGGNDGIFYVYRCSKGHNPKMIVGSPLDLGLTYAALAHYLKEIKQKDWLNGNLEYPGKLMGLAAYGTVVQQWIPEIRKYVCNKPGMRTYYDYHVIEQHIAELGKRIGITFDKNRRIEGQMSYDLAATFQHVLEQVFMEIISPIVEYHQLPVCFSGGVALNVLLNTKLAKVCDLFVGPAPNDSGIALGAMLHFIKPLEPFDGTYSTLDLLDDYFYK